MSEAKHTPGPWITRYYDRVTRSDDVDGSKSIAHVYGWREHPSAQQANRNLIAAAPDMLAALKMLREIDDAYGFDLTEPQRDQMHDAIAKAEGALIADHRDNKELL